MLWEDAILAKRLEAATAAYVAVHVKGRAVAELQKDAVMLGRRAENNGILFHFFLFFSPLFSLMQQSELPAKMQGTLIAKQ